MSNLIEKRQAALAWLGERWLIHPANRVERLQPKPRRYAVTQCLRCKDRPEHCDCLVKKYSV